MLKNVGSNWTLNLVQIVVFMALARFTLNTLTSGPFGVWEAIVAAAGPLQLLILGVPMATVRAVAERVARNDPEGAERALGQSVTLTLLLGLAALGVGAFVWLGFDARLIASATWDLSPEQMLDARRALAIVLGNLAVGFCLRLPYAVFEAHHDFVPRNLVLATGFLAKLGLTVALLSWHADLTTLASVQVLVAVLEFAAALTVSRRRHPEVRFRPARLSRAAAREILSFSVFAFLLNMGALLAFQVDALVIGANRTPQDVAVYGMGNKVFDPFVNLLLAIGMVVMPLATSLRTTGRADELRDVFLKWSKVATCLVLVVGSYLLVLGPEFLAWWMGPEYEPEAGRLLQVLMVSFFLFLPVRGVALPILMGVGRPRGPAFGLLAMGLANLLLSLWLVREHGVLGVAVGTAVPNVIFALWFARVACGSLGVGTVEFLGYVGGRAFLGVLPGLGLLLAVKLTVGASGFWPLLLTGLLFVGLCGALQVLFVWRGDRFLDPYAALRGRLGARGGNA